MSCLVKPKRTFSIPVSGKGLIRFCVSCYYNLTVEKCIYNIDVDGKVIAFSESVFNDMFEYTM